MIPRLPVVAALTRRELAAHLRAPGPYVLASLYLLAQGFVFGLCAVADPATAPRALARALAYAWLLIGPALAAASFVADRQSGELSLFAAEPVAEGELVLAKALGAWAVALPLAGSFLLPGLAGSWLTGAPTGALATSTLALLLLATTTTALGVLASALATQAATATLLGGAFGALLSGAALELGSRVGASAGLAGAGGDPFWMLDLLFRGRLDSRPLLLLPAAAAAALVLAARLLAAERRPPRPSRGLLAQAAGSLLDLGRDILPPLVVLALVHAVATRAVVSVDASGYLRLAAPTLARLAELPGEVVIHRTGGRTGDPLGDLLDEFVRAAGGKLRVEPLAAETFRTRLRPLGLNAPPAAGLVLEHGRELRVLDAEDLDVPSRGAEENLSRALGALTAGRARASLLLAGGHGERPLRATHRDGGTGIERLRALLAVEELAVREIWLGDSRGISEEGAVLGVLGPRELLPEEEVAALRDFLGRGGSLLLALDPEFPEVAAQLLPLVGATSPGGVVVAPSGTLAGGGPSTLVLAPDDSSPLGRLLGPGRVVVPSALALDLPAGNPLLRTGADAALVPVGTSPSDRDAWSPPARRVVAATAERGRARVVVLGDSDLLTDELLREHPGNGALATTLVTWLARLPPPPGVSRRPLAARGLVTEEELASVTSLVGVVPALLVLAAGALAWARWRARLRATPPPG